MEESTKTTTVLGGKQPIRFTRNPENGQKMAAISHTKKI
jgi:hypothetical protein